MFVLDKTNNQSFTPSLLPQSILLECMHVFMEHTCVCVCVYLKLIYFDGHFLSNKLENRLCNGLGNIYQLLELDITRGYNIRTLYNMGFLVGGCIK